jgi:hypothetical protein
LLAAQVGNLLEVPAVTIEHRHFARMLLPSADNYVYIPGIDLYQS